MHDFHQEQEFSREYSNAPWWKAVYRRAFPGLVSMTLTNDGQWGQFAGIDRTLVLKCGKVITVDEKVRRRDYDDFALERWSDQKQQRAGWIQKHLATDYLAYAFIPSERCYLLPFQDLQRAWWRHCRDWVAQYPAILAKNKGYVTECTAVPIPVVLNAVMTGMLFSFDGGIEPQRMVIEPGPKKPPAREMTQISFWESEG